MTRIVVDAMGGDAGLDTVVQSVAKMSLQERPLQILLVGDATGVTQALVGHKHDPSRLQVVHASGVIKMEDSPRAALAAQPECSIAVAMRLLKTGEADALVSAGHTGATILAAVQHLNRTPGVSRAALAAVYPTEQPHGPNNDPFALMLDVGATLNASAQDLVGFAVMGTAYAQIISDNPAPRVALLSNGTEPNKGTAAIREAHQQLLNMPNICFAGNVEGLEIPRGTVDVIVCEGFLGNVVLKILEGVSEVASDLAKDAYARKFLWRLGLTMLGQGLRQLRTLTDWQQYGGAPLLGFDRVIIKAHGRSNERAIRNAIKVAAKAVDRDLCGQIRLGFEDLA